jgi:hypothetical protein
MWEMLLSLIPSHTRKEKRNDRAGVLSHKAMANQGNLWERIKRNSVLDLYLSIPDPGFLVYQDPDLRSGSRSKL